MGIEYSSESQEGLPVTGLPTSLEVLKVINWVHLAVLLVILYFLFLFRLSRFLLSSLFFNPFLSFLFFCCLPLSILFLLSCLPAAATATSSKDTFIVSSIWYVQHVEGGTGQVGEEGEHHPQAQREWVKVQVVCIFSSIAIHCISCMIPFEWLKVNSWYFAALRISKESTCSVWMRGRKKMKPWSSLIWRAGRWVLGKIFQDGKYVELLVRLKLFGSCYSVDWWLRMWETLQWKTGFHYCEEGR